MMIRHNQTYSINPKCPHARLLSGLDEQRVGEDGGGACSEHAGGHGGPAGDVDGGRVLLRALHISGGRGRVRRLQLVVAPPWSQSSSSMYK